MARSTTYLYTHRWQMVAERANGPSVTARTPADLAVLPLEHIAKAAVEHFCVYYLNTRNRVTAYDVISIGTLNGSLVHPREVYHGAVIERAAGIVVAHNHPSGDPTPSREDLELTRRLREAGKVLGIELLDHIIVSPTGSWISMKERDLL
jgi:DNA repair protein RadC